ncbi:ORF V: Enzymatic polyprotein [Labeo rohita]|uniref:ribonuclease H n=1 Tax=Labeo rohita TaxID=84645 RepID=A0ABQ8LDP7_LABRO|nr:ORF V: Enzymatic polyprotein [Labeo rohita]
MAILQVYQAKVLKDLHEGVPDPELLHELRSATDYALRATKVTAQALGRAMSTMVVQERHLWLNLAEMRDAEKARFLDAPISQAGLFGEAVEEFAQQFSTAKQQTEAIKHILPRRAASAGSAQPTQQPPSAPRRGKTPYEDDSGPATCRSCSQTLPSVQFSEGGSSDLSGSALDEGTSAGFGFYPAVCRTADGYHMVNKRAISFFSGRNLQHLRPSTRRSDAVSIIRSIRPHDTCTPVCSETTSSFRRSPLSGGSSAQLSQVGLPGQNSQCGSGLLTPGHALFSQRRYSHPWYTESSSSETPSGEFFGLAKSSQSFPLAPQDYSAEMRKGYSPIQFADGVHPSSVKVFQDTHVFQTSRLVLPRPEGRAFQSQSYKVSPHFSTRFSPSASLSPRVFTKVAEAALAPLRVMGIRILNYLDDWLILAHSWDLVCAHRDMVLNHLARLGLRVNWEKSKLSPAQRISFLGVELDSVSMSARLSPERAQSVLRCAATLRYRSAVPLKQVQRLLGHMASSAAVTPLGLMHMRPLQHWLHTRVPRWAWRRGTFRVNITPSCCQTLSPWTDIMFLRSGVPLEQVSRRIIVTTDASKTGWGATCNGQAASGVWTGPRLFWHINCLELLAVLLALRRFHPMIWGKHVLVRSDNTATVAYINHQGGVRSFRMSQLARHLLLWSQHRLKSLRATHIPGEANRVADSLSRQVSLGGEWRLHPQSVQLIWDRFGQAQVDLFASPESTHCQLWYGLTEAPPRDRRTGTQLAKGPTQVCFSPLCKVREDEEQILLVAPFWPNRTWFSDLVLLASAPPWRIPLRKDLLSQGKGTIWHPRPRSLEPPPLVPGRDQEDFRDLSPSVVNTLLQARAPSTRRLYDLRWRIFVNWCSSHGKDPRSCGIKSVLSFLQEGLDRHLSASTLKVHVAAISANHDLVGGRSVGKHDLIIRFLRGARRLNPPRPHLIPSWDLAVVLQGLQQDPFEPLQSVKLDALSFKTALLTALTSIKRVGDLQALSVNSSCLEFGPAYSHVVLRPRPGYVPKVPTTPFRDQVVTLQALSSQGDDPNLIMLCPVRALRIYMERTQPFRRSEQLFVCYGGQQKGRAVSKQRISHWLVNAIRTAYLVRGLPCPLEVRAHSTRGIAASAALANGASLTDICRAAGWATPNTFARFYNLRTEPVSARVLVANS